MKFFLLVLLAVCGAFAAQTGYTDSRNTNQVLFYEDSCRIDSTQAKILPMCWTGKYASLSVMIEARDDSSAGFASDSACVAVEIYQVFPFGNGYASMIKAHPDTTIGFIKWKTLDSLNIKAMDSNAVYKRNLISIVDGSSRTIKYASGDTLKTLQTSGFGAVQYSQLYPDNSPAIAFKLTGKVNNAKRGVGSMWKFRVYGREKGSE